MELRVVATGSAANTYILCGDYGESIVLDAGVPLKKVLPSIPDVRKVSGCLITHEHMDHARAWKEYTMRGIRCIASAGTWDALGANVEPVKELERFMLDKFAVMPFKVQHDAAEPFGFLIQYKPTGETALYATDTYYLRYTFPGVNYWIVECNYCEDMIDGETNAVLRNRLKESHMGLNRLIDALKANDLTETYKIVLIHLSDSRSDEMRMTKEIERSTGIETVAASAGLKVDLNTEPF